MRIFVSGATGVIGRRAVPWLVAAGHSVTAVARDETGRARLTKVGARCVDVDLFDRQALERAVDGHDVLVNLATHIPHAMWRMIFRSAWRENDRIRTLGVRNLVDAAYTTGVRRIIQESFAPIYPDRGDDWIDESTPLEPTEYNATVLDAEAAVSRVAEHGRIGVILRFAGFYGPDAIQVRSYIQALRLGWAPLPGGPHPFISSVSHDDAAHAVVAALDVPSGAYNVADDEPVRRAVFFGTLAHELGLDVPQFLPDWTTRLFGVVGETMARSLRISNARLREATSWRPLYPSVREGWPAMLDQLRSGVSGPAPQTFVPPPQEPTPGVHG